MALRHYVMLNLNNQRLLVVAPHPDDEVIGCGGLITRIKNEGGKVFVLFLTVGDTNDFSKKGFSSRKEREKEIEQVAKYLRFDNYHIAFPGNERHLKLDTIGQHILMNMIERESRVSIEKIEPTIVVFPSPTSYNQDHRAAAVSTHATLRPGSSEKYFVRLVISYEEPADDWTPRPKTQPNFYIPLNSTQLSTKLEAMKLYHSQIRPFPTPRSLEAIESLARLRGTQSKSEFAEGFMLYRIIV